MRQWIETDQRLVDKSGMRHYQAAVGEAVQKSAHQAGEVGGFGEIVGAGEAGVEGRIREDAFPAKCHAQYVKQKRLWAAEPSTA